MLNLRFASQGMSYTGRIRAIQTAGWIHWIRNEEVQLSGERDLQLQSMFLETAVHCLETN